MTKHNKYSSFYGLIVLQTGQFVVLVREVVTKKKTPLAPEMSA